MPHSPVRKKLFPLYAAADAPAVQPILDALRAQGFPVSDRAPDRRGVLLLFLSDRLSDEQALSETFFRLDAKGFEIVPVNLDGTKPPELIENALYSRNTIFAERYSTEELVNRIVSAKPLQAKKSRLPLVLALGAAALLLVAAIVLVIKLLPAKETAVAEEPTPAPTAVPTEEPIPPIPEIPGVDPLSIAEVVYVGDRFVYFTWDDGYLQDDSADDMRGESAIAQSSWQDEGAHFYSKEDGQEIPFREFDASYLRYLKNLKHLTLANVRCELPDLSALSGLRRVTLSCCEIPSLSGLSGSGVQRFEYHGHTVTDFSPLSDCSELTSASLDIFLSETADFSGFHPPKLSELTIANAQNLRSPDFSWLSQCTELVRLQLDNTANLTDLTFVSGCTALERLSLRNLDLRRLDGIETLKSLRIFSMIDVSELRDISAIEGCTALEVFQMAGYPRTVYVNDLSALGKLPHLYYLSNLATGNTDLNYLKELPTKNGIDLIFASNAVTDWSGLGAIESYDYIYMNLWGGNDGMLNAAPALAYLREPVINELYLRNARNVDLSMLSHVQSYLGLEHCDIGDFSTLGDDAEFDILELDDCRNLTSLNGLERLDGFGSTEKGRTGGELYIENCLHLADWSALSGMQLSELYLIELSTLPDFSTFTAETYCLNGFAELTDLTCFEGLPPDLSPNIYLVNLPKLSDIATLYNLHGNELMIGPEWKEQAEELVARGAFQSYEIVYPDGAWQPNDGDFALLSLDELSALPPSVLKRVRDLAVAGDLVYDPNEYHLEEDASGDAPILYLVQNDADEPERIPIETGTVIADLSILKDLTGLRRLTLTAQPFETLEGIQYLASLEVLDVSRCENLIDASAAFTLLDLRELDLSDTGVTSIRGIQNLTQLTALHLCGTAVTDLAPVLDLNNLDSLTVSHDMETAIASLGEGFGFSLIME